MTPLAALDQRHVIAVLARIASHDGLPVIAWYVPPYTPGQLEGRVPADDDDAKRAAIAAYADFLGTAITSRPYEGHIRLAVTAAYRGVEVTVYAHVEQRETAPAPHT
ncbi:hypothetical protein ACFFMN_33715 [Planobispora siamensis]|uniref:Uncharacterized protein n=1 Tax=Planobispora siamensis TaxID=936338 RepID=A0A8J3SC78_9ACTN|nr:hypothetical protein [Planobispora siamensis]GIH91991.1 hypothetical protein Psi01_26210 [Planobispora siamensis]